MKLNKKQKRVLISIPIVVIAVAGMFPFFDWMLGGDKDAIAEAFRLGLAGACGGAMFPVLSLLFNWPMDLRDND
jgi:hypothetical protein